MGLHTFSDTTISMFCLALCRLQFTKSYDAYKALALGADAVSVAEEF